MEIIKEGSSHLVKMRVTCGECKSLLQCTVDDLKEGYSGMDAEHGYYVDCAVCHQQIDIPSNSMLVKSQAAIKRIAAIKARNDR